MSDDFDDDEEFQGVRVPITEKHLRMIIAELHDQGRGHVLADMIEGVTGERLPDGTFHPRKFPIRDPVWNAARKKPKEKRHTVGRRTRRTPEQKAASLAELEKWKAANPDKMAETEKRRQAVLKQERKGRPFVGVDLEGFDTGRYFTDDRRLHSIFYDRKEPFSWARKARSGTRSRAPTDHSTGLRADDR